MGSTHLSFGGAAVKSWPIYVFGLFQLLQETARIHKLGPYHFISNPFQFITNYQVIWCLLTPAVESIVNGNIDTKTCLQLHTVCPRSNYAQLFKFEHVSITLMLCNKVMYIQKLSFILTALFLLRHSVCLFWIGLVFICLCSIVLKVLKSSYHIPT